MKLGLNLINLEQLLFKKAALILFMCNATGWSNVYSKENENFHKDRNWFCCLIFDVVVVAVVAKKTAITIKKKD